MTIGASANERRVTASAEAVAVPSTGPIVLDGRFNEEIWQQAPPIGDFLQREPAEGQPPTMRTEARMAYDDSALYVAVHAFDTDASKLVGILTRRDQRSPSIRGGQPMDVGVAAHLAVVRVPPQPAAHEESKLEEGRDHPVRPQGFLDRQQQPQVVQGASAAASRKIDDESVVQWHIVKKRMGPQIQTPILIRWQAH